MAPPPRSAQVSDAKDRRIKELEAEKAEADRQIFALKAQLKEQETAQYKRQLQEARDQAPQLTPF